MTDGNIQQADKVHSVQATRNNIEEADMEKYSSSDVLSRKTTSHKKRGQGQERALFIMVCCITFTFLICHLPRYMAMSFH